jgi:hypothetical protein
MNKADLIEALAGLSDNDAVVIDLDIEEDLSPDLYHFTIDVIGGIKLVNGGEINEIRLTPTKNITDL